MMRNTCDIAIVGAGVVGAACAAECAEEGLSVTAIERECIGGGATAAAMGHIVVMDDSEPQFALTNYSQKLWHELRAELPPEVEYQDTGTIWVAADDEEMREVHRKCDYYTQRGVPTEILDVAALAEAEPALRRGLAGGLLVPEDGVLYPPAAAKFLLRDSHHIELLLGRSVTQISPGELRLNDGTRIAAGTIIVAAGVISPELCPGVGVARRKGHLVITDRYPGYVRHQLIELGYLKSAHSLTADSVAFNVQPRQTGQLLIGSSRQYGAEHTGIDHSILRAMILRACEYIPGLAKRKAIRTWTGFRAATPDKLPLIGPSDIDGVYLATGHEGLGITTSLATAKLLVDQVVGRDSAIPFAPYLPSRFAAESSHA